MSLQTIKPLTERELQEYQTLLLEKSESHMKYFSTVLTIFIVLAFIGVCILIYTTLSVM